MTTFLEAAASYYGLGEANTRKSEVFTENGEMIYIVELKVSAEDMIAIARRMQEMRGQEERKVEMDSHIADGAGDYLGHRQTFRDRYAYEALDPVTRGKFGSFARFKAWGGVLPEDQDTRFVYGTGESDPPKGVIKSEGIEGRKVEHLDAPEDESTGFPEAVWVDERYATSEQFVMASDSKTDKHGHDWLLIQVAMLTPDQRARYVQPGEQQ